jgi:hypothetical protein
LPPGYVEVYTDLFTVIDPNRWSLYGPGNNEKWGQQDPQFRTGFYHPDAVKATPEGMVITTRPDPQGRTVPVKGADGVWRNERGWQTGVLQSKIIYPLYARFEVCISYDLVPGHWVAGEWATVAPGGWRDAEMDNHEQFAEPFVRQATHLKPNGGAPDQVSYNVARKLYGSMADRKAVSDPGGPHTYMREFMPDGPGHGKFRYEIDGNLNNEFSTKQLAAIGQPHDAWIARSTGWPSKLCVQTNGAGGAWPASAGDGPFLARFHWFRVSVKG